VLGVKDKGKGGGGGSSGNPKTLDQKKRKAGPPLLPKGPQKEYLKKHVHTRNLVGQPHVDEKGENRDRGGAAEVRQKSLKKDGKTSLRTVWKRGAGGLGGGMFYYFDGKGWLRKRKHKAGEMGGKKKIVSIVYWTCLQGVTKEDSGVQGTFLYGESKGFQKKQ